LARNFFVVKIKIISVIFVNHMKKLLSFALGMSLVFAWAPAVSLAASFLFVGDNGYVGIGNSTPQHMLDVSGAMYSRLATATSTVNWNAGNVQTITLTGTTTFVFNGGQAGGLYKLIVTQDGTGGRAAVWPASVLWVDAARPQLSPAPNAVDIMSFVYNGTNYFGSYDRNFAVNSPTVNGLITTRSATGTSVTFSHTVNSGSNQVLIVTSAAFGGDPDTSATYDGQSMTQGSAHGAGTEAYYGYWYLVNPPIGTHDVVISYPSSNVRAYAAITVRGVDQSTPLDSDAHQGGNDGNPSVSVTSSEANEYILYFAAYGGLFYTPNDAILYTREADGYYNTGAGHLQAAASTVSVGGTGSGSSSWDLVAIPIRPAQ
jgi:hypothetical protein